MKKLMMVLLLLAGTLSSLNAMEEEPPQILQILVKRIGTGEEFHIDIDQNTTVAAVKRAIEKKKGIPPIMQRLRFFGKEFAGFELKPDVLLKEVLESRNLSWVLLLSERWTAPTKRWTAPSLPVPEGPTVTTTTTTLRPTTSQPSWRRDASSFTPGQKKAGGVVITTAVLIAAVAGVMKIRSYRNTKKKLIKKYNLDALTPVQNKVWLATVLAFYRMPGYLHRIIRQNEGSLADLVGDDPRAVAELYYGHAPTDDELSAFLSKFFSGIE